MAPRRPWRISARPPALARKEGEDEDEDEGTEAFDDALQDVGCSAGAAWQCAEDADKAARMDQVMMAFNRPGQRVGTDRAVLFSAAFGADATVEIESRTSAEFADTFEGGRPRGGGGRVMRRFAVLSFLAAVLLAVPALAPPLAGADPPCWECRERRGEFVRERRKMMRDLRRADSPREARRACRRGMRQIARERREIGCELRHSIRRQYRDRFRRR